MRVNPELLDDEALLEQSLFLVNHISQCQADLIALVAEIDRRGSYTRRAYTSTRDYCEKVLKLTRAEAHKRIAVARLSRRVPGVLRCLAAPPEHGIHLSGLVVLAPHLTPENAAYLLPRSVGRTREQIRALIASFNADRARQDGEAHSNDTDREPPPTASTPVPQTICFTADPALVADLETARAMVGDELAAGDVSSIVAWALRTAIEATEEPAIGEPPTPPTRAPSGRGADPVKHCPECARAFPRAATTGRPKATSEPAAWAASPGHPGATSSSAAISTATGRPGATWEPAASPASGTTSSSGPAGRPGTSETASRETSRGGPGATPDKQRNNLIARSPVVPVRIERGTEVTPAWPSRPSGWLLSPLCYRRDRPPHSSG